MHIGGAPQVVKPESSGWRWRLTPWPNGHVVRPLGDQSFDGSG
jgi:hypothetical protein